MCNAYGLRAPVHKIEEAFSHLRIPLVFAGGAAPNLPEREMIRPTEAVAVVRPSRRALAGAPQDDATGRHAPVGAPQDDATGRHAPAGAPQDDATGRRALAGDPRDDETGSGALAGEARQDRAAESPPPSPHAEERREAARLEARTPEAAEFVSLKWDFAPARPKAPPVINFRSEGRRFQTGSRGLILASHFFEYTGARYPKTRWRFTKPAGPLALPDEAGGVEDPFAIAGLIRAAGEADAPRTSGDEPWPESVTMLTTAPGPDVAPIHDRQVVIVERADWAAWLFGGADEAAALLRPAPAGTLAAAQDEG